MRGGTSILSSIFLFLVLVGTALAEENFDNWKTPTNAGAVLKNAISPTDLVNLATGEFALRYPFPTFQGRGFSYTPVLSFSPSYTQARSSVPQTYFGAQPAPTHDSGKPAYSTFGFGWSLSPFGYISQEKKYDGTRYYEYRIILPGGGSERIIPYGSEIVAANDPDHSVPEWEVDEDYPGKTVYLQKFLIRSNPFSLVIKRYRTKVSDGFEWSLYDPIYDNVRWYAQSMGNDKYYFNHPVYHRQPIIIAGSVSQFGVPKSITAYFKEYDRWDISAMIPHSILENKVRFLYSDAADDRDTQIGYVHAAREQLQELIELCNSYTGQDCGDEISEDNEFFSQVMNIPWNVLGRTDYVSGTRPEWIFQEGLGYKRLGIHFVGYNRQETFYEANLAQEPFSTYCALQNGACPGNQGYGSDVNGPYLMLLGYPDNPYGAYRAITGLKPFTTYTMKGRIEVKHPGWYTNYSDCTPKDLQFTQYINTENPPNDDGYYALVKVGSFATSGQYQFQPSFAFKFSSLSEPNRAVWFATQNWNGRWKDGSNEYGVHAGIINNLDAYLVNCWTVAESGYYPYYIDFEETFTTAAETQRTVYISAYNPKAFYHPSQPIQLFLRSFKISLKPTQHLVTGIDYTGQDDEDMRMAFNLHYDNDPDNDGQPNLARIQQVGYLTGEAGQSSLPPTTFTYDATGKAITRIDLPTGGNVQLTSYSTQERNWDEQDPWRPYYTSQFYDGYEIGPKQFTKKQNKANTIAINDGRGNQHTTTYNYVGSWVWNSFDQAFYTPEAKVTNPLNDRSHTLYNTGVAGDYPTFGKVTDTRLWDHTIANYLRTTHNDYEIYDVQTNPRIFHVRTTGTQSTNYGEDGQTATTSTNSYFTPSYCDLPYLTTFNGYTDVNGDESKTVYTYTNTGNFKCLLQETSRQKADNTELAKTVNEYYGTGTGNKQGFLKKVTSHNLQRPSENTWTELDYDIYGNIIKIKDSAGAETTIEYDADYHYLPIRHTNPLSQQEMQYYDYYHRAINVTGINAERSYIQLDDLGRICRFQLPGGSEPAQLKQTRGSAGDICQTQGVNNPDPREGFIPIPPPGEGGLCNAMNGNDDCTFGDWCCDIPLSEQGQCIPLTQECPTGNICTPPCNQGYYCCNGQCRTYDYCPPI